MSIDFSRLLPLGWSNFFLAQLPLDRLDTVRPARVVCVERSGYRVTTADGEMLATLAGRFQHEHADQRPTVGDWVLLQEDAPVIVECLQRRTFLARRQSGGIDMQAIAANVDLMLVVSGLDAEFNLHRIERYLVMAAQAGVTPLVVLTKQDLAENAAAAVAQVRARLPVGADVLSVDARSDTLSGHLAPWLSPGTTLIVVGSSGVGKSTLVNNLAGGEVQSTGETRRDAKGRHTTTARALIRLSGGACIIDVPGMREVGLTMEGGLDEQFRSIADLARACRFIDCTHEEEPGCAVRTAVERGELEADVWAHYLKLRAEERHHVAEHERRRRERVFGKMVRSALATKQRSGR
jgi:ribosome biogenesis GTPase